MPIITLADHGLWASMLQPDIPLLEKILRPIIVYFFLVILLRLFGKRELAQLNPFDLVVLLSLSNTVQNAIIGEDNSVTGGLVGAFTLCAINYLVLRFLFRHRRLDQIIEGRPTPLIEEGRILKKNLAKELITREELTTILHRQGFSSIEEIQTCILEPGGTFAVEGKQPRQGVRNQKELIEKLDQLLLKIESVERRLAAQEKSSASGTP